MHAAITRSRTGIGADDGSDLSRARAASRDLGRALGWFSLGLSLGLVSLMMPRVLAPSVGRSEGKRWGLARVAHVKRSIHINRSPEDCYRFWRDFKNFPRFMPHIEHVEAIDATHSRWRVHAPHRQTVEWHAELTSDLPGQQLGWRTMSGTERVHTAMLRFTPLPGRRGTRLEADVECHLPAGAMDSMLAHMNGDALSQPLGEDLRRFKQWIETGEISTTLGQPRGQRNMRGVMARQGCP